MFLVVGRCCQDAFKPVILYQLMFTVLVDIFVTSQNAVERGGIS